MSFSSTVLFVDSSFRRCVKQKCINQKLRQQPGLKYKSAWYPDFVLKDVLLEGTCNCNRSCLVRFRAVCNALARRALRYWLSQLGYRTLSCPQSVAEKELHSLEQFFLRIMVQCNDPELALIPRATVILSVDHTAVTLHDVKHSLFYWHGIYCVT